MKKQQPIHMLLVIGFLAGFLCSTSAKDRKKPQELSPLDRILATEPDQSSASLGPAVGSTYAADGTLAEMIADFRASKLGDLVTIIVSDQASAVAKGVTNSKRQSSANASIKVPFGGGQTAAALQNLVNLNGQQALDGQAQTSRQTTLSTALSARVIKVLRNGDLVIEGTKLIAINSEHQTVNLRGIVRSIDLGPGNLIRSDRIADLEVRVNGKGVVNDAIRRPNFLYRLLLGVLPF